MDVAFIVVVEEPHWQARFAPLLPEPGVCRLMDDGNLAQDVERIALVLFSSPANLPEWHRSVRFHALIAATCECDSADLVLPPDLSTAMLKRLLDMTLRYWRQRKDSQRLDVELMRQRELMREITQIGISLTAEKELPRLLAQILREGRKLSGCEAASLFLVEKDQASLRFKLFQNEALPISLPEQSFPIDSHSIAGYVALSGEIVNVGDVYELPEDRPYHFDPGFDHTYGYRTRELLTLPMQNHRNDTIGVLQFLNVTDPGRATHPFDQETCNMLQALASQAAVAIDNSLLLENIRDLFEGFVSASVMAIEARDPITSGHSFRVADYTCRLAEHLEHASPARLRELALSRTQMRELRYAALLHDFGKVGVREHVLQKAKKLAGERMDMIRLRILWLKERILREFAQAHPDCPHCHHGPSPEWRSALARQLSELDEYLELLERANEPAVLHQDHQDKLAQIRRYPGPSSGWPQDGPFPSNGLLSDDEFLALSVTRGSLTVDERVEIESHVSHTFAFLSKIPWTGDLARIPLIAGAHHERLDGSGYPFGLQAIDIPVQARMMSIADIFDALTARDRPYKLAVPEDKALDILDAETKAGKLDPELVTLFVETGSYRSEGAAR